MPHQLKSAKRPKKGMPRPLFEELPSLDMRWLARHDMVPRDWGRRSYDYSFIDPRFRGLVITSRDCEVTFPDGGQQIVSIHWQVIEGMCQGSTRPIFGCPCCDHRTFKLYDLYNELYCWKCAFARGARYVSQQVSAKGRKYLQSQRLRCFLGEYPGCSTIHKPLFMHPKTYNALVRRLRQLEAKSGKCKSKYLTERTQKPNTMYQVEVAHIANA